ncbi:MAG TPA: GNAT family N-acetyltransferase [Acidimicrobiales bacterium]
MPTRPANEGDVEACVAIVEELPDFFTDNVPGEVRHDLGLHQGWVTVDDDCLLGFAVVERRSAAVAEILWMAVRPARRGSGVGTALLEHVLAALGQDGVELVEVKTLDAGAGYTPYEATRAFWSKRFVQIDTIDPYPGWSEGNPAAIFICAL